MPLTSRPTGITGSRKTSIQYRAYERIDSRDTARSSLPSASGPSTRRRLFSSVRTRGPSRRQARSATQRNTAAVHRSGSRHTTDQPSW
jgi:hypothetical protein